MGLFLLASFPVSLFDDEKFHNALKRKKRCKKKKGKKICFGTNDLMFLKKKTEQKFSMSSIPYFICVVEIVLIPFLMSLFLHFISFSIWGWSVWSSVEKL